MLANAIPPVAAAYQSRALPTGAVAVNETVPVPHLEPDKIVGAIGIGFILAVTAVLVNDTHPLKVFLASA